MGVAASELEGRLRRARHRAGMDRAGGRGDRGEFLCYQLTGLRLVAANG
jgi:hypothetical protein